MHHQDPDIVGCYSTFESIVPYREDRRIVTHWRTWMLLKHYQWKTPFYLVDKEGWKLKVKDKEFEFVFTPYAHFAGAICTYDKESGILFSSDIFCALTDKFSLFANKSYLEGAKLFHKHYMPHKTILNYALRKIEEKNPEMICPQHGSIIKKDLVDYMINGLKDLECGLYLMDDYVDDIYILNQVDEILKTFIESIVINESFENMIKKLFDFLNMKFNLINIKIDTELFSWSINDSISDEYYEHEVAYNGKKIGKIVFYFLNELFQKKRIFLNVLVKKLEVPLGASLYRYLLLKKLEQKEKILYEKSVKDPLTNLYNRNFLDDFLDKKIK
ncbi:oxygen-binding di-iron domain-containing protein [Caminibacter sp.]